jgi:hypothetical protein
VTYPVERLWDEIGYVAFHFHWSLDDLLDLDHANRSRFVRQIEHLARADRTSEELPPGTLRSGMPLPLVGGLAP